MSEQNPETTTALRRLKKALAAESLKLKGRSAADPSTSALAGAPDIPTDVGTWRAHCYRQLALLRPDVKSHEAAAMAIELSRDLQFVEQDPTQVAIDACRLLEQSRDS